MARIVIVGGGFAGLTTALSLESYTWKGERPEILLIDSSERFVFAPLLYELISGELKNWEVAPRFEELLENSQIHYKQATVEGIDLDNRKVHLSDGTAESYDSLALTAGGVTPVDFVLGAREFALPFRAFADAQTLIARLKSALESGADPVRIALVGGGASGVELACKLADVLKLKASITLFDREKEILNEFGAPAQTYARKELKDRNIRLSLETKILSVNSDGLTLQALGREQEMLPFDIVLWTVGTAVPALVKALDVPKDATGRLKVEPTLQLSGYPEVFAYGDLAAVLDDKGQSIGSTAQSAYQEGQFAAWNIWATLEKRPLLNFRYTSLGQILGLGIDGGFASLLGLQVSGKPAYVLRRLVYLLRMPTPEQRLKVALNWAADPLVRWLDR
ncbi:MAG: NAD(P)/FAD-dependent oxidoreductase [Anaerolineae bacterium]|nr:NAD(P)/FAD-dependent oxidoreductase [Gloeobacterales cyanobacterium ES-bin-313]